MLTASPFPDREALTLGLVSVFSRNGSDRGRLTVLKREQTLYATTFPCEIVRCRFEDGSRLSLFCKYAAADEKSSHGQRGGVSYEIEVYRQVLQPLQTSTPIFYGAYADRKTGTRWLVLEYLRRSLRVGKVPDPKAMRLAARWIGRFHAINEARLARAPRPPLTSYDPQYYRGWARRTSRFAGPWHERFPWLAPLCEHFERALGALAARPQTVIHGEYYPHNIMFQAGVVRPVDWETAAIGTGEIDLAALTEGWTREASRQFEVEYQRARWPHDPPADFQKTLNLARVYMQLRWLGDRPEWTQKGSLGRFNQLRRVSRRLGVS